MATPVVGHFEKVTALASNGRHLLVGGTRPTPATRVSVYDLAAHKTVAAIDVPSHVLGLAFANDLVLAACADGALRVWHLAADGTVTVAGTISEHAGPCTAVAVAPGGGQIVTVGVDGFARRWTLGTHTKVQEWALSTSPLRAVAIDPTGEYLAAAGDDGVVRVVTLATNARREMAGHEGAVHALAFTPRDGRLVSAGDDATLRLWYLVGAVEFESRGGDDSGHKGAVLALAFPPTPAALPDGSEPGDRVYSAGADGKVKVWRLDDRRKPRALDAGSAALRALCFVAPPASARGVIGSIVTAGDARVVSRYTIDATGTPGEARAVLGSGFDAIAEDLKGQKPAREAAVKTLGPLDEPEALDLLLGVMASDKDVAVRTLAVQEVGARGRRAARAKLRELLDDAQQPVRFAALASLRQVDGEQTLGPLRAALASRHADLRAAALRALVPLREASPLVPGMVAEKLTDPDASVRLTALDQLTRLHPANAPEPLRVAYERGPADLKAEVIVRAAFAGMVAQPDVASMISRALDDPDATVRRYAFTAKVVERASLAHALEGRDESLARTLTEIARRGAVLRRAGGDAKAPTDEEIRAARAAIPSHGSAGAAPDDRDLEPLLTAVACRTPDTALRGARALAQLGDTRALGALLQISREADPALRKESASALQELCDARARKRLVWMLDDADVGVRSVALDAYGKFEGTQPIEVAEAALRSAYEDVRVRGLEALVKLGAGAEAEALLADAIEDETPKVRGEAFRTLWAWHTQDPAKALDRALSARFPDLRLRAVEELLAQAKEPWAVERLRKTIGDRDGAVAKAAYDAVVKTAGDGDAAAHLAAMASTDAGVRVAGARGASHAAAEGVRAALTKLLADEVPAVRIAAIETLDKLLPGEAGAHHAALQSSHLDLRVRAAELLAVRHDDALVDPMRALLADKELARTVAAPVLKNWRERAAASLATLGAHWLVKYLATELLKDDDAQVREQAARGLATAARQGDEGHLLDALGHGDAWVRSWASDGLSRLGDARALPVLTGNLRNDHLPIRLGAILSFAALGPEGYGGMLQGLEDASREVQDMVFTIILARDLRAFRRGEAPDLLTSALSSQRPEVRYAAARALELRTDPEGYLGYLIEVLTPPKPDAKSGGLKDWPPEEVRGRILVGLANALAGDQSAQRYAAAQALNLRKRPVEFFREAQRAAAFRSVATPWVPDTAPRAPEEADAKPAKHWLRRLFSDDAQAARAEVPSAEQQHLRRLAFGAYVGMLRQGTAGDDEGHRVRRDAVDRIVELGLSPDVGAASAVPALSRALDDGNHLVRKAAFAGLKRLFADGADEPLALALASQSSDVARAALDELAARGMASWARIATALNARLPDVRRYAFELLERLSPRGSLDPLLAALSSEHADLRVGVIERLATSNDDRVIAALGKALESDHDDLRLRAAELLVARKDERALDVLAAFLRADDKAQASRATDALVRLGTIAAARALSHRAEEVTGAERAALVRAIGRARNPESIALLAARFDDDDAGVRNAAFEGVLEVAKVHASGNAPPTPAATPGTPKYDQALLLPALRAAARAKDAALRVLAANHLDAGDDPAANDLLVGLFGDRETAVRQAAVYRYARRVIDKGAPVDALEAVLRAAQRELVLPAAEGVAAKGRASALRPLLLVVRAGEPGERERALLALGTLGDARALDEVEVVANGGTKEEPVEPPMQVAATEALGRMANRIADPETRQRVIDKVEQAAVDAPNVKVREAAVSGLRWIGGERARAKLEALVHDASVPADVSIAAVRELGELGDAASEPTLAAALDSNAIRVRAEARKALDKLFPKERTRIELLAVDSRFADVAGPAAAYLATEGDPATLVARLASLKNPALRSRLRYGLLRRGAAPAKELAALLEDENPSVREEAAWLAGASTGAEGATPSGAAPSGAEAASLQNALVAALRRAPTRWIAALPRNRAAEVSAWARVLWAATRLGARAIVVSARELVRAPATAAPAPVRRGAARALEALGSADDVAALRAALGDTDPGVRAAAARALEAHAPEHAAEFAVTVRPFDPVAFGVMARRPVARESLLATGEGRRLALPTMITGGEAGALASVARSTAAALDARLDAMAALGRVGGDEAVATLGALAFDKKGGDADFRKAAYRALKRARRAGERAKKLAAAAQGAARSTEVSA